MSDDILSNFIQKMKNRAETHLAEDDLAAAFLATLVLTAIEDGDTYEAVDWLNKYLATQRGA